MLQLQSWYIPAVICCSYSWESNAIHLHHLPKQCSVHVTFPMWPCNVHKTITVVDTDNKSDIKSVSVFNIASWAGVWPSVKWLASQSPSSQFHSTFYEKKENTHPEIFKHAFFELCADCKMQYLHMWADLGVTIIHSAGALIGITRSTHFDW